MSQTHECKWTFACDWLHVRRNRNFESKPAARKGLFRFVILSGFFFAQRAVVVGVRSGAQLALEPELKEDCVRAMLNSHVEPLIETYEMRDAKKAFLRLAERAAVGKVVLVQTRNAKL